jgi:peptidyl-prolyl cis-trans isomerase B (cyclophilin B)
MDSPHHFIRIELLGAGVPVIRVDRSGLTERVLVPFTTEKQMAEMIFVLLQTTMGDILIELNAEKAPKTVANFVAYVEEKHYDGTIFHRVIDNFMIQGGGMTEDMRQKGTRSSIQNEADNGLKNINGSIAMARTSDPHSATAQFFINVRDNAFLDHTAPTGQGWGYAVFGRVVGGMDVVERIKAVPTTRSGMHQDVPATPIMINSARLVSGPEGRR